MITFRYKLLPSARIISETQGLRIVTPTSEISFAAATPGLIRALSKIQDGIVEECELIETVVRDDGESALPSLYLAIAELDEEMQLQRVVVAAGSPVASIVPISKRFQFDDRQVNLEVTYGLSRFAYARRSGDQWVMESPRSYCRVVFHDGRGPALLERMARPFRLTDIADPAAESTAAVLLNAGMFADDEEEKHRAWEFHDLLFHARVRSGRHNDPYGRLFRFPELRGVAVKPPMSDAVIDLYRPDIANLMEHDMPFAKVLEARRSDRIHDERALTKRDVGEFLFRAARIREIVQAKEGELTRRPYPGAGAAYELEIYPIIHRCDDIPDGLYHYCPSTHRLEYLRSDSKAIGQLQHSAAQIVNGGLPQILLVITARFSRLMWRYGSVGYALVLKDIGGLFQTMYLVATAMGLAACAAGGGDADLFADASGLDYLEEGAVGEFIIGRRRTESALSGRD